MACPRPSKLVLAQRPTLRLTLLIFLVCAGLTGMGLAGVVWYAAMDLPSLETLHEYQPSLITRVYSDDGQIIGQFYVERRILTPLTDMPQDLINAVIAVEDARFFEHPGLDVIGILRAAWTNLRRGGKFEGASTITQQLTRSLFLSPERTYRRKIRELILAYKIETVLSKEQILEMYLNQIYFGHGAYGVHAASLTYFEKPPSKLNLSEAALLAGLPKAPSTYSPYNNSTLAKERQKHVLARMVQAGFTTATAAEEAAETVLAFQRQSFERIAPFFKEHVRQELVRKYGETMVYKGGLQVFTTLNIEMQRKAEQALHEGLRQLDKRQGWRGPIRRQDLKQTVGSESQRADDRTENLPETGDILQGVVTKVSDDHALVVADGMKGRLALKDMLWARRRLSKDTTVTDANFFSTATVKQLLKPGDVIEVRIKRFGPQLIQFALEQTPLVEGALLALDPRTGAIRAMVGGYDFERSQFNRALFARRQPGSAFKPVIYATALKQGLTPATLLMDAPVVYEHEDPDKTWKPENYEKRFYGPITLREALKHSRNAATVRLLEQIGVHDVIDFAKTLGITSPLDRDLSLALGSSSVTLEELTSAYGVFANQGLWLSPYTISLVKSTNEEILEQHLFEPQPAVSKETAYLVTNMLMDVIRSGTGRRAQSIGRPIAGKTGTTNAYRDAWFVGYTSNLTTGVWVGFDGVRTLGKVESGAHAALPIWTQFMTEALQTLPVITFDIPEGIRFAEVETTTGKLASHPSQGTTTEVFTVGTAPPQGLPMTTTNPIEFYELDQMTPDSH